MPMMMIFEETSLERKHRLIWCSARELRPVPRRRCLLTLLQQPGSSPNNCTSLTLILNTHMHAEPSIHPPSKGYGKKGCCWANEFVSGVMNQFVQIELFWIQQRYCWSCVLWKLFHIFCCWNLAQVRGWRHSTMFDKQALDNFQRSSWRLTKGSVMVLKSLKESSHVLTRISMWKVQMEHHSPLFPGSRDSVGHVL